MRKLSILLCAVSIVALVAACGGGGGGGTLTAEEFAEDFPEEFATAVCKSAFQCPEKQNPAYGALLFGRTVSQEDCVDKLQSTDTSPVPIDDIESGLIEFDPEAAADCIAELEQRSSGDACDIAFGATPLPESCLDAAKGTLANGETCASGDQCQSGSCDTTAVPDSCTGECVPRADEGEECGGPGTQGGPTCRSSLVCVPDDADGFVCAPLGSLGEGDACVRSITTFTACGGGLLCEGEQDNTTCQATTLAQEGEDCSGDLTFCTSGTACTDNTCSPTGGDGDPCMATSLECQIGFYCDTDASQCTPTKPAGESCESNSECQGDLECSDGSGTCEQPEVCTLSQ